MPKFSYTILIPAYNEAQHLEPLLREIRALHPEIPILLVDDGSDDGTGRIARQFGNTRILRHAQNLGKGAAFKTGIQHILAKERCADAVLFMDADGQHPPALIHDLIQAFETGRGDFILGKRNFRLREMPLQRILSNWITSKLISWKLSQRISDSQCGFRLIACDVLRKSMPLHEDHFALESELLIKAGKRGARFCHVPVPTIYKEEKSHIRPGRDIMAFIKMYFQMN